MPIPGQVSMSKMRVTEVHISKCGTRLFLNPVFLPSQTTSEAVQAFWSGPNATKLTAICASVIPNSSSPN